MKKRLAIISDIHGNAFALKEVLKDIEKRNVDLILNLGDSLYGGIDPTGTADIIMNSEIISILGNQDLILLEDYVNPNENQSYNFTKNSLHETHFEWIKTLDKTVLVENEIFLCHGTPNDCNQYLLEDITTGFPKLKNSSELEKLVKNVPGKIICCGHSHLPNVVQVGEKLIINPGSVGLQSYIDDAPNFHVMESGSPHARYSIMNIHNNKINVEQYLIEYDWFKAATLAEENGRKDWVKWLKTGRN